MRKLLIKLLENGSYYKKQMYMKIDIVYLVLVNGLIDVKSAVKVKL